MDKLGEVLTSAVWRGEDGYEAARRACVWNARKPSRFPDVIVLARTEQDVVAAVRFARERNMKVAARSGGHSWTASSVRSGGMLIDLSQLQDVTFDPSSKIARVQPGVTGRSLMTELTGYDRFFPSGHCPSVGIAGFLLNGGWGWNSRLLGPACLSIEALEVVTAEGELITADATKNQDFLWAARGSGPGFFAIVTRFHLRTYPRPTTLLRSNFVYPVSVAATVLSWVMDFAPRLSPHVELAVVAVKFRSSGGELTEDPVQIVVNAVSICDSEADANDALAILSTCPVRSSAVSAVESERVTFDQLYAEADALEPEGLQWEVDSIWTDAPSAQLVPEVTKLLSTLPNSISHLIFYPWREQSLGDAALSIAGKFYLLAMAGWSDPNDEADCLRWPVCCMRTLEPLSKGVLLATENLVSRPARYLSEENARRLEQLRLRHDPTLVYHSFLTEQQ